MFSYLVSKFKNVLFLWCLALVINIITFFLVFYQIKKSGTSTIALAYNIIVGVEWYGSKLNLLLIPLIGLILSLVNLFLHQRLKKNKLVLPVLVVFVTLCLQFCLLLSALLLFWVN